MTDKLLRKDTAKQYKKIRKILKDGLYKREPIKPQTEAGRVRREGRY